MSRLEPAGGRRLGFRITRGMQVLGPIVGGPGTVMVRNAVGGVFSGPDGRPFAWTTIATIATMTPARRQPHRQWSRTDYCEEMARAILTVVSSTA